MTYFKTYFVYFHTFSYKFKVQRTPTEFGLPVITGKLSRKLTKVSYSKPAKNPKSVFRWYFSGCQRRSFLGRHLRQASTHISGKKQNFLVVVVHTWNKTWRRKKKEELRNRSFFSANTWGPGANVLWRFWNVLWRFWNVLQRFWNVLWRFQILEWI